MIDLESVTLAEWRDRAIAAELASERKEHLLTLLSDAQKQAGRIVIAVGVSTGRTDRQAIYIQSNSGDEDATIARLLGSVGPYLNLLTLTITASRGREAQASIWREALADLVRDCEDTPMRDSDAWIRAKAVLSGVIEGDE